MLAHINIGSNLGDSRSIIEQAVAEIFLLSEGECRRSSFIESEPWGFDSANKFLNIGIEIETTLNPEELLDRLQTIERQISPASHRNKDGSYRDRLIDIDLIFIAEHCSVSNATQQCAPQNVSKLLGLPYSSPRLTLPHPRAKERDFVVEPILQLHPELLDIGSLLGHE